LFRQVAVFRVNDPVDELGILIKGFDRIAGDFSATELTKSK
jgi:hypothetical protein